jgi:hypothetical protein
VFSAVCLGHRKLSHGPPKVKSFLVGFHPGPPEVNEFLHEKYSHTGPLTHARAHSLAHAATTMHCRSLLPTACARPRPQSPLSSTPPTSSERPTLMPLASSFCLNPVLSPVLGPGLGLLQGPWSWYTACSCSFSSSDDRERALVHHPTWPMTGAYLLQGK